MSWVRSPWKNASTLMVVARNNLSQSIQNGQSLFGQYRYDYSCMLLKRSAKSKFFAKAFVFPGGATEPADFHDSWLEHFSKNGFDLKKLSSQLIVPQVRIPLYSDPSLPKGCLPEVGYRISAIRETFEETGVLLCKPADNEPYTNEDIVARISDISQWQERVHQNPEVFLLMCQQYQLFPDIWSLYEWSNWLTPAHLGPKRYDTIFYVCVLDHVPKVRIDGREIVEVKWNDPVSSIWEHVQGQIWLAPPQVYELSRLANFSNADDLKVFAEMRQRAGMERWLPIGHKITTGFMTVLPGDNLYLHRESTHESNPDNQQEDLSFETSGEMRNRIEFVSPVQTRIGCNIEDPHGHKRPLNLVDMMTKQLEETLSSKL